MSLRSLRKRLERLEALTSAGNTWRPYVEDVEGARRRLAELLAGLEPAAEEPDPYEAMRSLKAALWERANAVDCEYRWVNGECYVRTSAVSQQRKIGQSKAQNTHLRGGGAVCRR